MSNKLEIRSGSVKTNLVNLFVLLAMGTIVPLAGLAQKTFAQNTKLPMTISLEDNSVFFLIVPDRDVSRSAYGGELKIRDVHFAKMFEVTQHFCQMESKRSSSYTWIYRKNGGRTSEPGTKIGSYQISCNLANDIAIAYGAGKPESTTVGFCRGGLLGGVPVCPPKTYSIPILNITGGKVQSWIQFRSKFKACDSKSNEYCTKSVT